MTQYVTTGSGNKSLHDTKSCPSMKGPAEVSTREASGQETELFDRCKMCHVEIVACEFCGDEYSIQGIGSHQNYCSENPDRVGSGIPVLDA